MWTHPWLLIELVSVHSSHTQKVSSHTQVRRWTTFLPEESAFSLLSQDQIPLAGSAFAFSSLDGELLQLCENLEAHHLALTHLLQYFLQE